jgi:hypothetical protein
VHVNVKHLPVMQLWVKSISLISVYAVATLAAATHFRNTAPEETSATALEMKHLAMETLHSRNGIKNSATVHAIRMKTTAATITPHSQISMQITVDANAIPKIALAILQLQTS